jgi:1-acyl-sn-glycerol-3-phosphate acyltransferase
LRIFRNIVTGVKLYNALRVLTPYRKSLLEAQVSGNAEKEREILLELTSAWGNHIIKTFDIRITVNGKENLPEKGPVLFVANHQSFSDIPIACAVLNKFQFGFVAKSTLERNPLYGRWIRDTRNVYIDRESPRASLRAIEDGIKLLEQGFSMMIFPEGARSKSAALDEFKKGSLRLATKPGVPVIPIAIHNAYRVFEEYGYVKYGVDVTVNILPAIDTKGMPRDVANNLSAEVENIIRRDLENGVNA